MMLQIILDAIEQVGGIYVVTADHGNAEEMVKRNKSGKPVLDKSGNIQILTSHTLQPVSSFISFWKIYEGTESTFFMQMIILIDSAIITFTFLVILIDLKILVLSAF